MVFLALKLSEPLDREDFSNTLKKHLIFDEKKITNLWEVQSAQDRYLVIKIYKGSIKNEGKILNVKENDNLTSPKVGSLYFLFSNEDNFVDWCNAFSLDAVPEKKLASILSFDSNRLINFLVENKLHYCLNPPETILE